MNTRKLTCLCVTFAVFLLLAAGSVHSQLDTRKEIAIPDIKGYQTLKCDFHMHTVFSDGNVWPAIRVEEAWRQGLDVISITDHIEYLPYKNDVLPNHNRPYELAKPVADRLGMALISGTEITRGIPPGHHNAIFLPDANPLDTPDFYDSIGAAVKQDAFVFFNHPGWRQPDNKSVWYDYQETIYNKGWLHGVEVVNGRDYYPLAHQWAIDKKLTMFGNSDAHNPILMTYDYAGGEHRPITLVFSKKRTPEGIRDALDKRRTAVWFSKYLIGDEDYLGPIFEESLEIVNPTLTITGNGRALLQLTNTSDVDFVLSFDRNTEYVTVPDGVTVPAHRTVRMSIAKRPAEKNDDGTAKEVYGKKKITVPFTVENLYVKPSTGMKSEFTIRVNFKKAE